MITRKKFRLRLPSRTLVLGEHTLLMGVINVTPDSFSGDGLHLDAKAAATRAIEMERDGADIIDIGGESTRPGAEWLAADEELRRVIPVLNMLSGRLKIPISIDTNKSEVAEAAAEAGAEIINDVTALRRDPRIAEVARRRKLPLILMHMRGEPRTMQKSSFARDAMRDVTQGLKKAVALAARKGVPKSQLVLDPGIGFGKSFAQNYDLIARLPELARLGFPILIGPSRKGFIGRTLGGIPENERAFGTAAAVTACILQGAHIVRVHDVREMEQVAHVADMLVSPKLRHGSRP
ncbi:MAG TPA: dihydropteroate synthase [Candidatus Dormibacteraeota bacterium]|nr:dihydropteroate synthase [Candidatus Dormibacteraeota bacterium]